jgi:tetratricopeptide (TPR) repeat protein
MRLADQLLQAGERLNEPLYVASAHAVLAFAAARRGALDASWEHVSKALVFFANPPRELTEEEIRPVRPQADVLAMMLLLVRGHLDRAEAMIERALASRTAATPRGAATLQVMAAYHYALRHDDRLAREWAERGLETLRDRGSPEIRAWGEVVLGWAEARSGESRDGIDRIVAAMDAQSWQSAAPVRYPQMIFMAEAYLAAGETAKAAQVAEKAVAEIEATDQSFFHSEVIRLHGETLLQNELDDHRVAMSRAEACFQHAAEIARQQGALLWQLRATTSLARLWAQAGRRQEAALALRAIYGTFTEGSEAPDLVDAAALLTHLENDTRD